MDVTTGLAFCSRKKKIYLGRAVASSPSTTKRGIDLSFLPWGAGFATAFPGDFRERGQKRARVVYGEPLPSLLNVSPGGELTTKDGEGDSHGGRGNRFS